MCVEMSLCGLNDVMYLPEDIVGLGIFAGTSPPSFDNAHIVAMAFEMAVWAIESDEDAGEKFKGDCLCPPDVMSL
jgi:hypothetical protein